MDAAGPGRLSVDPRRSGAKTGADRGGRHLDVILTGVPRSGTTLVCALLNRVPSVVALHEPMPLPEWALRMTREMVIDEIDHFFVKARNSLMHTGMAPSRQVDAQVPSNPFSDQKDESGVRHAHGTLGVLALAPDTVLSPDFVLVVKHTAGFAVLLEQLSRKHPCFAVIREPIATLASWATIDAPIRNGRTPAAERLDPCLAAALATFRRKNIGCKSLIQQHTSAQETAKADILACPRHVALVSAIR